ncbi:unnamed protein product [Calypogeia fissa]
MGLRLWWLSGSMGMKRILGSGRWDREKGRWRTRDGARCDGGRCQLFGTGRGGMDPAAIIIYKEVGWATREVHGEIGMMNSFWLLWNDYEISMRKEYWENDR